MESRSIAELEEIISKQRGEIEELRRAMPSISTRSVMTENDKLLAKLSVARDAQAELISVHRGWCEYCKGRVDICCATAGKSYECAVMKFLTAMDASAPPSTKKARGERGIKELRKP